mmetsp:Transcript_18821/g.58124  ORF Transcript_18821/g.58124 Transcript_18821/m.58124 type:complete len:332 (+) Transcript_18821:184-1179(+)
MHARPGRPAMTTSASASQVQDAQNCHRRWLQTSSPSALLMVLRAAAKGPIAARLASSSSAWRASSSSIFSILASASFKLRLKMSRSFSTSCCSDSDNSILSLRSEKASCNLATCIWSSSFSSITRCLAAIAPAISASSAEMRSCCSPSCAFNAASPSSNVFTFASKDASLLVKSLSCASRLASRLPKASRSGRKKSSSASSACWASAARRTTEDERSRGARNLLLELVEAAIQVAAVKQATARALPTSDTVKPACSAAPAAAEPTRGGPRAAGAPALAMSARGAGRTTGACMAAGCPAAAGLAVARALKAPAGRQTPCRPVWRALDPELRA